MTRNLSKARIAIVCLLTTLVALGVFGAWVAAPRFLPDSALVGTWVSQSGEPQASLVLSANGTAVIENVPGRVFQSATVSTSGSGSAMSVSGTGSWSRISDTQLGLGLNSGSAAGRWQPVSIVGWPWDLQLRIPYGDPEVGRTFNFAKQ
jgi:hypothetical protein